VRRLLILAVLAVALAGIGFLLAERLRPHSDQDTLYGNVEIRQVDLAFNSEGRVTSMVKREGDLVKTGETIASLDAATYQDAVNLATARQDSAEARLAKLLHGTRPEDIDQARANAAAAKAQLDNAAVSYTRQQALVASHSSSQQALDDARRALETARAQVAQTGAALAAAVAGPRTEDIDDARAQLRETEASLGLAQTQLSRTRLVAPSDGIVMTRVIEPGAIVMPTSIVYSVAISGEVWVRAFVPETMLSRVAPGTAVEIFTDGQPGKAYHGTVGYVSPEAEFTPKTVETPELRTQLVYRIRIRVDDADPGLRQGQPVTIKLPKAPQP